jgi:hypothetical protein
MAHCNDGIALTERFITSQLLMAELDPTHIHLLLALLQRAMEMVQELWPCGFYQANQLHINHVRVEYPTSASS